MSGPGPQALPGRPFESAHEDCMCARCYCTAVRRNYNGSNDGLQPFGCCAWWPGHWNVTCSAAARAAACAAATVALSPVHAHNWRLFVVLGRKHHFIVAVELAADGCHVRPGDLTVRL
jgi:hypothetical protein